MKLARVAGLPLLVLAAGPAAAQSTVTIGGILDAGVRYDRGTTTGSFKSVGSGQSIANRITITGAEDLGGGLRATFVLESGLALDTGVGANNPPGVAAGAMTFGRTSLVAIGGPSTGYLAFGRQYTPLWGISAGPTNDPFGASWLGGINTVYSATVRTSNAIGYTYGYGDETTLNPAPRVGLGVSAVWSLSEVSDPSDAGDQKGVGVSYGDGTWWAGYGYHRLRGSNTTVSATAPVTNQPTLVQQTLGAAYYVGVAQFCVGLNTGKNGLAGAGAIDRRNWDIAARVQVTPNQTLRMLVGRAHDRAMAGGDFNTVQIAYQYNMSKRAYLYAAYGQVGNDANAAATLAASQGAYAKGSTPRSLIMGLAEKF